MSKRNKLVSVAFLGGINLALVGAWLESVIIMAIAINCLFGTILIGYE